MPTIIQKIIHRLKKIAALCAQIPHVFLLNVRIIRARWNKRPIVFFEVTTEHDIFCIYGVIKGLYAINALMIYSAKGQFMEKLAAQIQKEFGAPRSNWIDVIWTRMVFGIDFYINTTLSYDIHVPSHARYTINFPHTITSKTKYDVFSPAIEKITDTVITGPAYEKDLLTYCANHNIKKIPRLHRLGGPKSDNLFSHTVNREAFLEKLGLDPKLLTIFYGPTYNQGSSIFSWLGDILKIPDKQQVNLIIKVHPGAYLDPTNKKGSGGVDWKSFFEEKNLREHRIYNVMNDDSTDYIMASDIGITDISTIWIEYYFLRKQIIFLDIPDFFKTHEFNSLGDFRSKYGYFVKTAQELDNTIADLLSGATPKKDTYDIDELLLYNRGHATEKTIELFGQMYKKSSSLS